MSRRNEVLKNFLKYEEETQHRVKHGIELYRKGFATLKVVDKDGNPVSGVKFEAKLKKHEFLHGANIFMLDEFDTEEYNEKYRKLFADCFNLATLPFYWKDLEPVQGAKRYAKDSSKITANATRQSSASIMPM